MNNEYCVIYASTDSNPMFIVAVSQDQNMISGFREEHYHFAKYRYLLHIQFALHQKQQPT